MYLARLCPRLTRVNHEQVEVLAVRRVHTLAKRGLLRQNREAAGLSQSDVARFLGVAPSSVSRWEAAAMHIRGTHAVKLLELTDEP